MVKINNYISTSQATPTVSTGGNPQLTQLLKGASAAAGEKVNLELREVEQAKRDAQQKGALAAERKRQADLALPQSLANIQKAQLGTLGTLLAIDEQDRQINEAKEAKAYSSNVDAKTTLGFIQAQDSIRSQVGPDGSGLFDATKTWWDTREKEIIDNAPSERAKLAALEAFGTSKTRALGEATLQQGELRKRHTLNSTQETMAVLKTTAMTSPEKYGTLFDSFNAIATQLKEGGLDENQVLAVKKTFDRDILKNTAEGFLTKKDLSSAKSLLDNESNIRALGSTETIRLLKSHSRLKLNLESEALKAQQEEKTLKKLAEGTLSTLDPKAEEVGFKYFSQLFSNAEATISDDPLSVIKAVDGLSLAVSDKMTFMPKKIKQHIEGQLLGNKDDKKVMLYSSLVTSLSSNPKAAYLLEGMSSESIAMATRVSELNLMGINDEEAVASVRKQVYGIGADPNITDSIKIRWNNLIDPSDTKNKFTQEKVIADGEGLLEDLFKGWRYNPFNDVSVSEGEAEDFGLRYFKTVEKHYKLLGTDLDSAKAAAENELRATYGITEINGREQVMEFAPESLFEGDLMEHFKDVTESNLKLLEEEGIDISNVEIAPEPYINRMIQDARGKQAVENNVVYRYIYSDTKLPVQVRGATAKFVVSKNGALVKNATNSLQSRQKDLQWLSDEHEKNRSAINQSLETAKNRVKRLFGNENLRGTDE